MGEKELIDIPYFPGCSLATTARENNASLILLFRHFGYNLVELEDWSCCGSSSAHSVDAGLAFDLESRNLFLVPDGKPLLIACPGCLLRLQHAYYRLKEDKNARNHYEEMWGKPFDSKLRILSFFELLEKIDLLRFFRTHNQSLKGLKFVSYYGCMLARPPVMRHEKNYHGVMEKLLSSLGATSLGWRYASRCCGTFLSVARPDIVTPMVNEIVREASDTAADCIITACAMCHMNLEVRCTLKNMPPILHLSEILSLAFGIGKKYQKGWFSRHLINPTPLLKAIDLL
jgi:heterodisulfide reductase subunit B